MRMRCEKAKKFESHRIAFFFLKKTGKIIDRSLFRIRIHVALPALVYSMIIEPNHPNVCGQIQSNHMYVKLNAFLNWNSQFVLIVQSAHL